MLPTDSTFICPICKGVIQVGENSNDDYEFISTDTKDIPVHFNCLAQYQGDDFLGVDNDYVEDFKEE